MGGTNGRPVKEPSYMGRDTAQAKRTHLWWLWHIRRSDRTGCEQVAYNVHKGGKKLAGTAAETVEPGYGVYLLVRGVQIP